MLKHNLRNKKLCSYVLKMMIGIEAMEDEELQQVPDEDELIEEEWDDKMA